MVRFGERYEVDLTKISNVDELIEECEEQMDHDLLCLI